MIEEGQVIYLSPRETYDSAIVGMCSSTYRIIYSKNEIIEILARSMDIESEEEKYESAEEFFEYNILGSHLGSYTPIYLSEYDGDEIYDLQEQSYNPQEQKQSKDEELIAWVDDIIG